MANKLVTITGASGSGKDSLLDAVRYCTGNLSSDALRGISRIVADNVPGVKVPMKELISHTTRAPRPGEFSGVDYYFVDERTFNKLEKVEDIEYAGNHYCLAADEVAGLGSELGCVIVSPQGLAQIREYASSHPDIELFNIFVSIDADTSKQRMQLRGDKPDMIARRLRQQSYGREYIAPSDDFDLVLDGTAPFHENVSQMCVSLLAFSEE